MQMGDSFKQAIFDQYMQATLHGWAEGARRRKKSGGSGVSSLLGVFGHREMKQSTSSVQVQMQGTGSETPTSSNGAQQPDAFEGIVGSGDEEPQIQDVQERCWTVVWFLREEELQIANQIIDETTGDLKVLAVIKRGSDY